MQSRRDFLKHTSAVGAGALVLGGVGAGTAQAAPRPATPNLTKFVDPLFTAIPKLVPDTTTFPGSDYYEIFMAGGRFQFSTQLPVTAPPSLMTTWGYGSGAAFLGYLGPTIEATVGKPVIVKYTNNIDPALAHPVWRSIDPTVPDPVMYAGLAPGRVTPHLHGGFTDPNYDGHPHSWWTRDGVIGSHFSSRFLAPAGSAYFEYSNAQPSAMLWYHDHAMGITRLNAYAGLAALYIIRDPLGLGDDGTPTNPIGLPAGPYEIPLVLQDKQFNRDGSLFYPTVGVSPTHPIWVPEFFGDTAVVNGRTFPFLNVEPRRYRFRMVNGAQARFFNMWLAGPGKGNLPLWVIGMEQSLLPRAVPLQTLLLAPGERADVIVDFTGIKPGTVFRLSNNANTPFPGGGKPAGPAIPDLMQFRVVAAPVGAPPDLSLPPASLVGLPAIAPLVPSPGAPQREIVMKETMDPVLMVPLDVKLNERWFDDPIAGIEERPRVGSTEVWQWINLTVDAHPMHMHLVKFQVLNRQAFNAAAYATAYLAWVAAGRAPAAKPVLANYLIGAPRPRAPEESGWKDTVRALPGEVTRVISTFDLPSSSTAPAEYVYHCHILEHEENEMMRPFQVVP
jgi:spore coat protein A, manganese oxidase